MTDNENGTKNKKGNGMELLEDKLRYVKEKSGEKLPDIP